MKNGFLIKSILIGGSLLFSQVCFSLSDEEILKKVKAKGYEGFLWLILIDEVKKQELSRFKNYLVLVDRRCGDSYMSRQRKDGYVFFTPQKNSNNKTCAYSEPVIAVKENTNRHSPYKKNQYINSKTPYVFKGLLNAKENGFPVSIPVIEPIYFDD